MPSATTGFAVVPDVFTPAEVDVLARHIEALSSRASRAGTRHLMSVPAVRAAADDARMTAIASEHLGMTATPFRATLFDKSPDANWLVAWHQDRALPMVQRVEAPGWGPWSVKGGVQYVHAPAEALERVVALRLSIDDSGVDNGPLRVLPGTEARGVLTDAQIAVLAQEVEPGSGLRLSVV